MRVVVLSDVHANLVALEAVLADADAERADRVWHLGDLVGYGPEPDRVIELMVIEGATCVMGNHDAAAAGLTGTEWFNPVAAEAAKWTAERISTASREWLANLPKIERDGFYTLTHGTLRDPLWEYLTTFETARGHFALMETPYSCVGHTHLPLIIREVAPGRFDAFAPEDGAVVELGEERLCFNPGGVGQPRDGDPRASYAVLDTDAGSITFHRVEYDVATTQRRMREVGLPEPLVTRLQAGR
ncbi:MAG: metallophosphoesterase family protein [Dehalococcoidia bacterium]|nr:metallophosphoesterase family protein [Dehalococcoidia bacterium]